MKKIIITVLISLIFLINKSFAQSNFEWDVKIDSLNKSKSELYAQTKMFVAENAYSAMDISQNNDPENGIILLKGTFKIEVNYTLYVIEAIYRTTVTFYIKDNRARIKISDLYNISTIYAGREIRKLEPFDPNNPPKSGPISGIPNKKSIEIMTELNDRIQGYVDNYIKYISNGQNINEDW